MNKLLAALAATLFVFAANAQTVAPAAQPAPAPMAAAPEASPAPKAMKAPKAHKTAKSSHKKVAKKKAHKAPVKAV